MEIWKTVKSAPNYEISNLGAVRNIKKNTFLKVVTNPQGYRMVCLSNKSKKQTKQDKTIEAEIIEEKKDEL